MTTERLPTPASLAQPHQDTPVRIGPDIPPCRQFTSPVTHPEQIGSTFGPRWKRSEGRYDFHRGLDFFGQQDEPVFSIGEGRVYRVFPEGSRAYPNGGNTLVIAYPLERPFVWEGGVTVDRVYGMYLHLAAFRVEPGERVRPGQTVALMGKTGKTGFVHLHFEIRLQTTCSLEYQRSHPDKVEPYGFDPHVHPFHFIPPLPTEPLRIEHEQPKTPSEPFRVFLRGQRSALALNTLEGESWRLNFNRRIGFDATTTAALDNLHEGAVRFIPAYFSKRSESIEYLLEYAQRPAYLAYADIHGNGLRRSFG
ncbi:MAG: M23 family metallopeptidase [Candidatus Lambdaproteobacteria bacterium]|nr:M23 family metallopeptidase [Candidatus Lambdaproteobacteria bacterium]